MMNRMWIAKKSIKEVGASLKEVRTLIERVSLLSAFCILVVGCSTATERSDQVNQDRVHQFYAINYDQEINKTSVW